MMKYIVIYPKGDRRHVDVAHASYDEFGDYDRASRLDFDDESSACAYAKQLAMKHGLVYDGKDAFLD